MLKKDDDVSLVCYNDHVSLADGSPDELKVIACSSSTNFSLRS